jgi:hypothetical protein
MAEIKRKLYKRGSSFETTLPMPIAITLDDSKQYEAVFVFDNATQRWYVEIKEKKEEN